MNFSGRVYLVGQNVVLFAECYICTRRLANLHDQTVGVCPECLRQANVRVGRTLVVHAPTPKAKWN